MTGVATISMEVELGWGTHDKSRYNHLSNDGSSEREALDFLLTKCEKHDIPVSFDVVGHLLHESCSGHHQGTYPHDWWSEDPGTDHKLDPLFYNPELVKKIDTAETPHEICTHTYSHILCEQVSDDLLDHELDLVTQLHKENGLATPVSFVTPRHQRSNYEILKNSGIKTIRKPFPDYESPSWANSMGPVGSFLWMVSRQHPTAELEHFDGVVETYGTPHPSLTAPYLQNGQRPPHPAFRVIPQSIRQKIHTRYIQSGIDEAIKNDKHIHLWTHLFNMANEAQYPVILSTLKYLSNYKDQGEIVIKKMNELPEITNKPPYE